MTADEDRIAAKAHELWEAEGRPHGRDQDHWDQAKEIIALHDSAGDARLPRMTGAETPVEEKSIAIDNEGEVPGLTDTGEHDLTSTAREPAVTAPSKMKTAAKTASTKADAAKTSAPLAVKARPAKGKAKSKA